MSNLLDVREHPWNRVPEPGTYRIARLSRGSIVHVSCPKCSKVHTLARERIGKYGEARDFRCTRPRCGFTGDLKLRGWAMYEIKYDPWPDGRGKPGTWSDYGKEIQMCCPLCKKIARFEHTIAEDGTVTPSVQCARTHPTRCTFHEMVKLVGYENRNV